MRHLIGFLVAVVVLGLIVWFFTNSILAGGGVAVALGILLLLLKKPAPYPYEELRQEVAKAFGGTIFILKGKDLPWGGGFPGVQFEKAGIPIVLFVHRFNGYELMHDCAPKEGGSVVPEGQTPAVQSVPESEIEIRIQAGNALAMRFGSGSTKSPSLDPQNSPELFPKTQQWHKAEVGGHVVWASDPRAAEDGARRQADLLGEVFQTSDSDFDSSTRSMSKHPVEAVRRLQSAEIRNAIWHLIWDNAPHLSSLVLGPDAIRWNTILTDKITLQQITEVIDRILWLRQELARNS